MDAKILAVKVYLYTNFQQNYT